MRLPFFCVASFYTPGAAGVAPLYAELFLREPYFCVAGLVEGGGARNFTVETQRGRFSVKIRVTS